MFNGSRRIEPHDTRYPRRQEEEDRGEKLRFCFLTPLLFTSVLAEERGESTTVLPRQEPASGPVQERGRKAICCRRFRVSDWGVIGRKGGGGSVCSTSGRGGGGCSLLF